MKTLLIVLSLAFCSHLFAQSQAEVAKVLDQMEASGKFSSEQIKAARKQLMGMDDSSYSALIEKATEKGNDPAFQKKVKAYINGAK